MTARNTITPEEFIRAWQSSETLDEAAQKLGTYKSVCHSRAAYYRTKGVPLKPLMTRKAICWSELQNLAETLQDQTA
jgi:hypothetical protein